MSGTKPLPLTRAARKPGGSWMKTWPLTGPMSSVRPRTGGLVTQTQAVTVAASVVTWAAPRGSEIVTFTP